MELLHIWGKTKPFVPLLHHMVDTGYVARVLLETPGYQGLLGRFKSTSGYLGDDLPNWLAFLCSLHDIGKCHPVFQAQANLPHVLEWQEKGWVPHHHIASTNHMRHEMYGGEWLIDYLIGELGWATENARVISSAVRGHHGSFAISAHEIPEVAKKIWEKKRRELAIKLIGLFHPTLEHSDISDPIDCSAFGVLLTGLMVLSDWISSNSEVFVRPAATTCLADYCELSLKAARQAVESLAFNNDIDWPEDCRFSTIFGQTFTSLRPVQEACEQLTSAQLPSGMVIIEAPMGQGKTEAALLMAAHWIQSLELQGLYFALPTEATSNQMYHRITDVLKKVGGSGLIKLVHGRAWLMDNIAIQIGTGMDADSVEWFSPKKRALLAPYGVGTVDQAMLAVLNVKHGFLRLFGLAGKVLVIDEVHAYDVYMSAILRLLLRWCRVLGIPVLLLSATLPENKRRELCEAYLGSKQTHISARGYPLITTVTTTGQIQEYVVPSGDKRVIKVRLHKLLSKTEQITDLAMRSVADGGCACVVANTVQSAQNIYAKLHESCCEQIDTGDMQLLLYHARFPACRRMEIEQKVLALFDKRSTLHPDHPDYKPRPHRAILVATQVVEQSLDVDFDCMITEISPIDLLLQRCGRLYRHERPVRPTGESPLLHILLPDELEFEGTGKVYEPFVLLKTLLAIEKLEEICIPQDIRPLIEAVYSDQIPHDATKHMEVALRETLENLQEKIASDAAKAKRVLLPNPNSEDFVLILSSLPYDESDDNAGGYLHAATRIGDNTRRVIMLEESKATELKTIDKPDREALKELCLHQVSIPGFWLADISPQEGFMETFECHSIKGVLILPAKEGIWKGIDNGGGAFAICNHSELGVIIIDERR